MTSNQPEEGQTNSEGTSALLSVLTLMKDIQAAAKALLALIAMEARMAGISLIAIMVLGFVISFFGLLTWLFLNGALIAAVGHAFGYGWGFLSAVLLNGLFVVGALVGIIRLAPNLTFSATRRQLSKSPFTPEPASSTSTGGPEHADANRAA